MNNLDEQIDQLLRDWFCNQAEGIIVETETGIHAIQQLLVMARIDATQKFSGLWGIGGDDNEHVAIYRRVYSKEMAALQSQLTDGGVA